MDRLDAMAIFVAVVDEGSLAGAARRFGRSAASITRAVALLEARVGERLLHRTTRSLKLTEAGVEQIAVYRDVLGRLAQIDRSRNPLSGKLSISAPELFGRFKVMPILDRFLDDHPGVTARMLVVNRMVDLVEEGVDLVVRIANLQDSALTAVRLGTVQRLVCAAPAYLDRAGMPNDPGDLVHHACIDLQVGGGSEVWRLRTQPSSGRLRTVAVGSRLALNSQAAALDVARRGYGICHPLSYQVADDIREGRLICLLRDFEPDPIPVHFVFHPSQRSGGIVRSLVEQATPPLRADLAEVGHMLG
ncbi:MAG TPA: LysR family transcriptional regulator [Sphingomonas sp.]|uniref:LysR family transcriptional regulator n=1 Tax=Sphingomonas sp. TaxID=28214 RepID=UPI002BBBF745|nr:LysR family transcriptional regulator [Sphingomonas sp.]HMI19638.1 LysR family transcriptional regulator [Sphingomonas sp.]